VKVAVYTIAKNEASFVERWYNSAKDADSIHILDTGSDDKTVTIARDLGIDVMQRKFDPWRFDVARNAALQMVPADVDYCISLDMDEVLLPGWREELERMHAQGVTRPRYKYTWSWVKPGVPGLQYGGDKIHSRHNYYWKHPVHEVITCNGTEIQGWCGLEIHHFPDHLKSRGSYFPLLELAVREDPDDDRNAHYLAREYYYKGLLDEAEAEFKRHLNLPSARWAAERAQSCRYLFKITGDIGWLYEAVNEDSTRREARVELAQALHDRGDWWACLQHAVAAMSITERPLDYLTEAFAWGSRPYDLAAIACHKLGLHSQAMEYGLHALRLDPYDDRLAANIRFYERAAA